MEFRILGPLEVLEQGASLPLGGPQPRAVLCLLLLRANQVVPSDLLIDELWGADPPATAVKTLRVYVSRLRRVLGDRLAGRAPGYVITVSEDELDLDHFERLRRSARTLPPDEAAGTLRDALHLWRGPPLADFTYEGWAQAEIARLDELRLGCLEERIELDLALGRHAELVGELEALVRRHPLREGLRRQLMLALYRSARQAEALQAYQEARAALVDELGIDPSPELQRLEKAILVQDPALQPPTAPPRAAPEPSAGAPPRGEMRKTVTVVFVDLADSSVISEVLDPEALRTVLTRYSDTVAGVLRRHVGTVEKFIGDAVMAVFGVPTLHEDDALRAVRASVEVGTELERLNTELEQALGIRLAVRIGINSGEVVVGDSTADDRLVAGDTVSIAAGLQQAAGPGEVVLGAATHRLVRDAVHVEALPPLALKRRREGVEAFRLVELLPGAASFARRLDTPLVGREQELAQLQQAFARATRERTVILFTVLGPAGIGKSRLAAELATELAGRATVLVGHCLSYGEGITFWPLAEIVHAAAGDNARTSLAELLSGEDDADDIAERIAATIGLTESAPPAADGSWAVRRLFETLARRRPLVAIFEDIHWAEQKLLDLIEEAADLTRGVPLLLLCLARTELLDHRPGWGGGKLNASSILLEPLSEPECLELVDELAPEEFAAGARGRIVHASEGNPLFVEQMIALMSEDGGTEVGVPPTIQSLLAARLDRLPATERAVLESAAVEGRQFHLGALTTLLGGAGDVEATVLALVRKELLWPDRSTLPGEKAFRFRHILVRDAAYRALAKSRRSALHERFAEWLEQQTADRSVEFEEIIGYHLEQAVLYRRELGLDDRRGAPAEHAAQRLSAAGRRARARGDSPAAANLMSRACALLAGRSPQWPELAVDLGVALIDTAQLGAATDVLLEAERRAAAANDERVQTHATMVRIAAEMYREPEGKTDLAYAEGMRAIPIFERYGDDQGLARAWQLVADYHGLNGHISELEEAARRLETHALRAEDGQLCAAAIGMLSGAIVFGPRPVREGIALLEGMLARPSPIRRLDASLRKELAVLRAMNGEPSLARGLVAEAAALMQELGLTLARLLLRDRAGLVELLAGDPAAAEREFRLACETLHELGERAYLANEAANLARALVELGRMDEADRATELSASTAASDDLVSQVVWRGVRAHVLGERGASKAAEELAREAVGMIAPTGFLDLHGDALGHLAAVLRAAGRIEEARAAAEEALRLYDRKGNLASGARTRAFLDQLGLTEPSSVA